MEAYVMDAFSARIFGGNQAGVVLPDRPLSDAVMRQIAAEFKHSETAFVTREPDGSVSLRYFTPAGEVELCGHATVASFALLRQLGSVPDGDCTAHTKAGELTVTVRGTALTEGLFYLQGTVFCEEDIGRELALLSCEEGFWILGFVGGGGA